MTRESFDRLLSWLAADRDEAAERYELIRRKLIKFFQWRQCRFPEDHADEVINRVLRKLAEGAVVDVPPENYCFGVAQFVAREELNKPKPVEFDLTRVPERSPNELIERRHHCLGRCLGELPGESRELTERFYLGQGREKIRNRSRLAAELNISVETLRVRVHRIRLKLEQCVANCLESSGEVQ